MLVVDNKWENCLVIVNLFELFKFNVIEVENGEDGLNKVNKFWFNLIIIDLMMLVMDGYEFMKYIRILEIFKLILVIVFFVLVILIVR